MITGKTQEVIKILEENKLTNILSPEDQIREDVKRKGIKIKVEDLSEPVKDFLDIAREEQKELDESMKESFRQRDERKKKEKLAHQRTSGSVSFIEEGEFIMCSKCLDNTPHKPAWGICQRCGTQYSDKL